MTFGPAYGLIGISSIGTEDADGTEGLLNTLTILLAKPVKLAIAALTNDGNLLVFDFIVALRNKVVIME